MLCYVFDLTHIGRHGMVSHCVQLDNDVFLERPSKRQGSFYIAQYPDRWTAQSALHCLPPLADLFIPNQVGFSGKDSSQAAIARQG